MGPFALTLDVTDDLPPEITDGQRLAISAWLFVPEVVGPRPTVLAMLHGGSYDKRYFHVEIPGHPGYSAAEDLCSRGHIVLLLDALGVGESSRAPVQRRVTRHVVALANHAAVRRFEQGLRDGALHPALPAVADHRLVGCGHSLGGLLSLTQQAAHRTYEALAVLGYPAAGAEMSEDELAAMNQGAVEDGAPDYVLVDRAALRSTFHWPDVPDAVVAADDALLVEIPYLLVCQARVPGAAAPDAAVIDVPVFICFGERDVCSNPRAEPAAYAAASDITLLLLEGSGHCHNFASSRRQLWQRMSDWIDALP